MMLILFIQPFTALAFLGDADEDGVPEIVLNNGRNTDNCPGLFNPDQRDGDNDGFGDACDPLPDEPAPEGIDVDHDGVPDDNDNCPIAPNPDQEDVDRDGIGNACDPDNDNDGVNDNGDNCPRAANPGQEDLDRDEEGNACDDDDDGDGQPDAQDACPLGNGAQAAPECRDNDVPRVTLRNPENGEVMRSSTIDFNFVVADNFDVRLDCEIVSDVQGNGMRSIHFLRGLNAIFDFFTGFTSNTFTVQNIPDGQYRWFAACTDDNGNRGVSETARFTVVTRDGTAPTVTLLLPADNSVRNNPDVSFIFRARDNVLGPLSCDLWDDIRGQPFAPRNNPLRLNQGQNRGIFQINNIPPGDYTWNVQCTDETGNTGSAPFKFSFTINPQIPPVNQCANGAQDAGEEGVDCGGVCANACPAPINQCVNGVQDVNEAGIDCGGVCANACPVVPPPVPPAVVSQTNVPDVRLDAEIHNEAAPARVTFTATVANGNGPFRFVWDFDDGTVVETATNSIEHIFEKPGRFDVSVRVFDRDGDRTTASVRIRIHSGVLDGERDVRLGSVVFESPYGYGEAVPGDQLMIAVGMTNTGVETMRNLKLTVLSYDLALHQRLVLNSIAAGETVTKRMIVDVPPDALPGEYLVQVSLTDENQLNKVTYHPLTVRVY